jgi:predicted RNA binding protein YcfA (HicA-like mRNA interferase family)
MNRKLLLRRLLQGQLHNVNFGEFRNLIEGFGFYLLRVEGSHHIFGHSACPELINLQKIGGQAKPYQIRQFLRLAEKYNLKLEDK